VSASRPDHLRRQAAVSSQPRTQLGISAGLSTVLNKELGCGASAQMVEMLYIRLDQTLDMVHLRAFPEGSRRLRRRVFCDTSGVPQARRRLEQPRRKSRGGVVTV
jgi:hypothetical protein